MVPSRLRYSLKSPYGREIQMYVLDTPSFDAISLGLSLLKCLTFSPMNFSIEVFLSLSAVLGHRTPFRRHEDPDADGAGCGGCEARLLQHFPHGKFVHLEACSSAIFRLLARTMTRAGISLGKSSVIGRRERRRKLVHFVNQCLIETWQSVSPLCA